jgi:NAD kinase
MNVYVEETAYEANIKKNQEKIVKIFNKDNNSDCIDLIICLGGDGTLMHLSSLFQVRFKFKNV